MRLALFRSGGRSLAVPLEVVRKVLHEPPVFDLPLLRACFGKVLVFEGQLVPLVRGEPESGPRIEQPPIVLICDAEFGRVGIPADKVERITAPEESATPIEAEAAAANGASEEMCRVSGQAYRLLNVNHLIEVPAL